MLKCYITDRKLLPPGLPVLAAIERNMAAGVDWIQIREKDLSARELFELMQSALNLPNAHGTRILVNGRMDVALACAAAHGGADHKVGCHLPGGSPSPRLWDGMRTKVGSPATFLVGVSCHTLEEVRAAANEGADYVFFGPVFPPRSKNSDLTARGLDGLSRAAAAVHIPVLALGGITQENAPSCVQAGAAGIAAITLFQNF